MSKPTIEFWYEFASTYSFLAAERVEAIAGAQGVAVDWRPFLLGPLFKLEGLETSPFNVYPRKGRYMWRDVARGAAKLGLGFQKPSGFPRHAILAARVALAGVAPGWCSAFTRATYRAEFINDRDIGDRAVVTEILGEVGLDPAAALAAAEEQSNKDRLKAQTDEAAALGLFGAPTFVVRTPGKAAEIFWGNDRLEDAVAWAIKPWLG